MCFSFWVVLFLEKLHNIVVAVVVVVVVVDVVVVSENNDNYYDHDIAGLSLQFHQSRHLLGGSLLQNFVACLLRMDGLRLLERR